MTALVKSPLQTSIVEGIYNDILTRNAQYYYFLGKTDPWTVADGGTLGSDGLWITQGSLTKLVAPEPTGTYRYELDIRNKMISLKSIKPSDVSHVIARHNWVAGVVFDMYDDSYSSSNPASSGATRIEDAKFYVLTSTNNLYKCISNNYGVASTIEPTGTSISNFTTADGYIWKFMYNVPVALQNKFYTSSYIPVMTALRNPFYERGSIQNVAIVDPGTGYTGAATLSVSGDGFLENNPYSVSQNGTVLVPGAGYNSNASISAATWVSGYVSIDTTIAHEFLVSDTVELAGFTPNTYNGSYVLTAATTPNIKFAMTSDPGVATVMGTITRTLVKNTQSLTWLANVATVTTTTNHGFTTLDTVTIAGVTAAGYNGTFSVTVTGLNTFTYALVIADPGTATVQGTATYVNQKTASSATWQSSVATLTATGHTFATGEVVNIRGSSPTTYNGQFTVLGKTVSSASRVFVSNTISGTVAATWITQSLTWATNVATVTTTTNHTFVNGDSVVIAGVTAAGYNGTFVVTVTGTNTFTYALAIADPGTASIQGTAFCATIRKDVTVTATSHGFSNGNSVKIQNMVPAIYNGTYTISKATTHTFDITSATNFATYTSGGYCTLASYTGIATINSTSHGFNNSDLIRISNVLPTKYNGTYAVSNSSANSFDVTINEDVGAYISGGSVTYTNFMNIVIATNPGAWVSGGTVSDNLSIFSDALWGNNKINVTGVTNVTAGAISSVVLDQKIGPISDPLVYGYGYDQTGSITTEAPFIHDYSWAPSTSYAVDKIIKANNNFYIVTIAGTSNATLPTHTTGTVTFGTGGTCALLFIGTQASAALVLTKTEARFTPIVSGGSFIGITVDDGGIGYTYCNILPQEGGNVTAIFAADTSIGTVDTVQSDVELDALNHIGSISYIKMVYNPIAGAYKTGNGYGVDTTVTITGDGVGATAVPVIVNGSIVAINVTNAGTGYVKEAIVTITPEHLDQNSVYNGAEARAILSPSGGHGSNAIKEFNSNSIMFYSVLSDERLHSLANFNDYRQFGIVKNPKRYGSTTRLTSTSATPCWLVTTASAINLSNFIADDELWQGTDKYRVITINDTKIVIQAYGLSTPTTATFTNKTGIRNGNTLTPTLITSPQIDKFSGEMLFIDNKLPFVVTVSQMIVFRTIIGF